MSDQPMPPQVPPATPTEIPTARPHGSGPPAAPVRDAERIIVLDVLRGVAVLGILLVNVQFFAFTLDHAMTVSWRAMPPLDAAAKLFTGFFAEFKFISLFSMLFGMGLALMSGRAEQAGRPFGRLYARRLLVLLALGLLHGVLLWYGDILSLYALLGFIALLCRNLRPRTLVILAVVLFFAPLLCLGGCLAAFPDQGFSGGFDWATMGDQFGSDAAPFFQFMADEERIYQSGTWGEMVLHRSATYALMLLFANLMTFGGRCLALFFLGIAMIRVGLFDDPQRHRPAFRRLLIFGLALGVPLQAAGLVLQTLYSGTIIGDMAWFDLTYLGSMGLSLAYLGGIALLCLRQDWVARLRPLAAVGRTALTNYLGHSVICGLVFYGYGLGLFGQVGHAFAFALVLAIFAAQLVISPLWLRWFRFGPVEWLWRSATYWRLQPMRR